MQEKHDENSTSKVIQYINVDCIIGLDRYWYRVSADTRQYQWVSVSADTYLSIGADTSSPVIRLPVSTVNTVAYMAIVSSLPY